MPTMTKANPEPTLRSMARMPAWKRKLRARSLPWSRMSEQQRQAALRLFKPPQQQLADHVRLD